MKHLPKTIAALAGLTSPVPADAASVVVDWLVMQPGGTVSAFTLFNDANSAAASGSVTVSKGLGFPGLPTSRGFAAGSWGAQPEFTDTLTGDASITGTEFRVAPAGGLASYVINFQVPSNQPLIVVVGGMLRNNTSATQQMGIAAQSDLAIAPVALRSTNAWSNGLIILNQGVSWNPLTQVLSTTAGADGDSEFAFFDVGPIAGPNARLSFTVPDGYAAGTGDSIFIGLGTVVPEPSAAGLLLLGAGTLVGRRRRKGR